MPLPLLPLLLPAVDLSPVEAATEAAGSALEQALLPLFLYCERAQGRADLTDNQFRHVTAIRAALDALAAYSTQVEQLLTATRANVTGLNRQLYHAYDTRPLPPEKTMQVDWECIALSLLERLRRPTAPASPLVARIQSSESFRRHAATSSPTVWPPLPHAA